MSKNVSNGGRVRNVCWTLFNYTEETVEIIEGMHVVYTVMGFETCPDTKKKHLQGYTEFGTQKTYKGIKKMFGRDDIHLEKRKGNQRQAIDYCKGLTKGKTPNERVEEFGVPNFQGKRTDLSMVLDMIKQGKKPLEIIDSMENLNYQTIRGTQLLSAMYSPKRTTKPICIWKYGSTGSGKTRSVLARYDDVYISDNSKWWDGYEQNLVILVDDYRCDYMKFHLLLRLLDYAPFIREMKGSHIQINSKYIIFTSPHHPCVMWSHRTNEDIQQLMRRIDYIVNMDLLNEIKQSVTLI